MTLIKTENLSSHGGCAVRAVALVVYMCIKIYSIAFLLYLDDVMGAFEKIRGLDI